MRGISKKFDWGGQESKVVDDVSLSLNPGDFNVVVGPSGSGKTTLLSILGLLLKPDSGEILFDENNVVGLGQNDLARIRSGKIGFVFQEFNLLEYLTTLENVLLAANIAGKKGKKEMAVKLLSEVGMGHRINNLANQLSGGEKQRVAICRALINEPSLLLADEPTGNLDSKNGHEIITLLKNLVGDKNITSLLVTHDQRLADVADVLYEMSDGRLAAIRQKKELGGC